MRRNVGAFLLTACIRERFEVEVVEEVEAHRHDADGVDREAHVDDVRRVDIGHAVAAEQRDLALVQPGQARRVQPGQLLAGSHGPCCSRQRHRPVRTRSTSPVPTRTPARASATSRSSTVIARAGLEGVNAERGRDVEQDAAGHDPVAERVDAELRGAVRGHHVGGAAAVHLAVPEDVAQRVEVARGVAVRGDAEPVGAVALGDGAGHVVLDGALVVDRRLGGQGPRARHGPAAADERGRRGGVLRSQVVEAAALVVVAPASPVGERAPIGVDISSGQRAVEYP